MSSLGIKGEHNALIDLANGGLQAFGPVAKKKKKRVMKTHYAFPHVPCHNSFIELHTILVRQYARQIFG